jgi:phasin family protein
MFPFSQAVTPAVRTHVNAQVNFLNDISKSAYKSLQDLVNLNIQLTQTLLEESNLASQELLTATRQSDIVSATAARAQPTAEKLRSFQQHISRVAADSQVELARVTEQHVQETSRTAKALADEVSRVASEETERSIRTTQESLRNFRDPFQHDGAQRGNGSSQARGSMQSGEEGSRGGYQAEVQGGVGSVQGSASVSAGGSTGQTPGKTGGKNA